MRYVTAISLTMVLFVPSISHANGGAIWAILKACGYSRPRPRVPEFSLAERTVASSVVSDFFETSWTNGIKWYASGRPGGGGVVNLRLPQVNQTAEVAGFVQLVEDRFRANKIVHSVEITPDAEGYQTVKINLKRGLRHPPDEMQAAITDILQKTQFVEPGPGFDKTNQVIVSHLAKEAQAQVEAAKAAELRLAALGSSDLVRGLRSLAGTRLTFGQEVVAKIIPTDGIFSSEWSNGIKWYAGRSNGSEITNLRLPHFEDGPAVQNFLALLRREFSSMPSVKGMSLVRGNDGLQTIQIYAANGVANQTPEFQTKLNDLLSRVRFE